MLLKITAISSVVIWVLLSLFIYFLSGVAGRLDQWLSSMFPGLVSLSINAKDPMLWRVYMFFHTVINLILTSFLVRGFCQYAMGRRDEFRSAWGVRRYVFYQVRAILLSASVFFGIIWFYFFSTKVWVSEGLHRGAVIIYVFHGSSLGLIVFAAFFFNLLLLMLAYCVASVYSLFAKG